MAEVGVQGWDIFEQLWYRAYDPRRVVSWGAMSLAGKTVHTSLLGPCGSGQGLPTQTPATSAPNFDPGPSFLFLVLRSGARYGVGTPAGPLTPLLAELKLIHGPHSPLLTLHPHEALVQAQVVANGILWKEDQPARPGVGGGDQVGSHPLRLAVPTSKPTCPFPSHLQVQPQAFPACPGTVVAFEVTSAIAISRGTHLPGCRVVSEEGEHTCEPVIDLIECPLLFRSL